MILTKPHYINITSKWQRNIAKYLYSTTYIQTPRIFLCTVLPFAASVCLLSLYPSTLFKPGRWCNASESLESTESLGNRPTG